MLTFYSSACGFIHQLGQSDNPNLRYCYHISGCCWLLMSLSWAVCSEFYDPESQIYDAYNANLNQIPDDIPENTRTILINGNNINELSNGSFQHLNHCFRLNLWNNAIFKLKRGAFVGLKKLLELDLR